MRIARILAASAAAAAMVGAGYAGFAMAGLTQAVAAADTDQVAMPAKVDNFRLSDQNLDAHELYQLKDAKAVVIVTQGVGCPISRNVNPALIELQKAYTDKGVEFFLLNSNAHDTRETIAAEAKEFGFTMPVLMDANQLVGEQLGVTRTATVYVIDPKTWKVIYRGPVDDRVTYERQK
jgi:peroxiredoxin